MATDVKRDEHYMKARLEANSRAKVMRENERLRAALRTFTEADWYDAGHGKFEAKLPGDVITTAKAILSS